MQMKAEISVIEINTRKFEKSQKVVIWESNKIDKI